MTPTAIVLDVILAAVAVLCLVLGVKRGFVKSIVRMIGSLVSLVAAFLISSPVAEWLFTALFRPTVENAVHGAIGADASASLASLTGQWASVLASLPEVIRNGLSATGIQTPEQLGAAVAEQGAVTAGDAATVLVDQLIAPLCVMVIQVIVFILLFIVLSIVVRLLAGLLDKVFSAIPLVRELNTALGAVAGLLHGAVLVLVLTAALQLYMTMSGASSVVTAADLEQTWITGWVMQINPLF